MKKHGLQFFLLFLSFFFVLEVNALESGELGDYVYEEKNRATEYFKMELSNGKVILAEFDSSKNAGVVNRMKEQFQISAFDGVIIQPDTRYLNISNNQGKTYATSGRYFSKPTRGDIVAYMENSDDETLSLSHFRVYLVEVVDANVPVFAHVIYGMDDLANAPSGTQINNIRFVNVSMKKDQEDEEDEKSNSNGGDRNVVADAGTRYCSDPNFIKPFKFLGKIFTILKILIPIIIIVFGVIDLSRAVIASKDDEIKKSIRGLAMRALAGVVIFFIPTLVNLIFVLIDDWNKYSTDYSKCSRCVMNPNDC